MSVSSWQRFTRGIPSIFFNPTLRFFLLRIICLAAVLLMCNVPIEDAAYYKGNGLDCDLQSSFSFTHAALRFERDARIYVYTLCSLTILHHLASAFGSKFSLPGIIDFPFVIGEAVLFLLGAITSQWAPLSSISYTSDQQRVSCEFGAKLANIPRGFMWVISSSLVLVAIMRIAEALDSNGHYFLTRYDITGGQLTARRAHSLIRSPNGFKVITGVNLWTEHFEREGRWLVLSRGIFALFLVIVAMVFAFSALVIDPLREEDEVPMKATRSSSQPDYWQGQHLYIIVGLQQSKKMDIDFTNAITASYYGLACLSGAAGAYSPAASDSAFRLQFITFNCQGPPTPGPRPRGPQDPPPPELHVNEFPPGFAFVFVNFTRLAGAVQAAGGDDNVPSVQVMISHSSDPLATVRRTELPILLMAGMNLLGFAQQHIVRQFKSSSLAALGVLTSFEDLVVSEISHLQPNFRATATPTLNATASLLIFPRIGFSDLKILQDYRDKSILKGFSSVGGLWTALAFTFGALFGSPLVRVVFGLKPLSVFGLAHTLTGYTLQRYKDRYSEINPKTLGAGQDLTALIVNHLIDIDPLAEEGSETSEEWGDSVTGT